LIKLHLPFENNFARFFIGNGQIAIIASYFAAHYRAFERVFFPGKKIDKLSFDAGRCFPIKKNWIVSSVGVGVQITMDYSRPLKLGIYLVLVSFSQV
jgi:hypothetical protein